MSNTQPVEPALNTLVPLTEAISYIIVPRHELKPPVPSEALLDLKAQDPLRYSYIREEQEYEHYERLKVKLKLDTPDISLYPIGSKRDQQQNDYARVFNGRIQNLYVDFGAYILMLRIDRRLLPTDFVIPPEPEHALLNTAH